MRIKRVPNQRQLIAIVFNTKNKGSQSQMMNNSNTKCATGNPMDNPKALLESFAHTKTVQVMQKETTCTQNAICTTLREATSNNMIVVTARSTFNDQDMHLLRLWVQSWRIESLFSVLPKSCGCWGEAIMSITFCWVPKKKKKKRRFINRNKIILIQFVIGSNKFLFFFWLYPDLFSI